MTSLPTTRVVHALHHEEDSRAAVKAIDKAVSRALGSSKKYDKAVVISLRWENDDLNLAPIERELLEAQGFLDKYDSPTSLLIVIYQGNADSQIFTAGQPLHILEVSGLAVLNQ